MKDILSKRERVERTLNFQPVDRVAIHDNVSYNPDVISAYTGRKIDGFDYTREDICEVIRETLDMCFLPSAPRGTEKYINEAGVIVQNDNWTTWNVIPASLDAKALKEIFLRRIEEFSGKFDAEKERMLYRENILAVQKMIGDDTVIFNCPNNLGLDGCWAHGLMEPFAFLYCDEPEIVSEYLKVRADYAVKKAHAIADRELNFVIEISDDLASKTAPLVSPDFLRKNFFPHLKRLVAVWHSYGIKVIYHSDGNWKILIPDFLKCGVDGFYCLEPAVGMDIIALKRQYPKVIWAGGLDGVDLMERGMPEAVRKAVRKQIEETDALNSGGIFLGTSSNVNPLIKPENYRAMIDEARSIRNTKLKG